ncbi:MAG TPA: adenylate/guanylate cyclase domain-containing protein [Candidatus Binatia bacterium]|jgi:adenylate cyclase|nr:adenylate/guanylate cyclase domain-containing protein [Candidatus Binatia bacterium]
MDPASYQAAGLYDPTATNAAERLALLEWLTARGITIEQMVRAHRETSLTGLAGDLALEPERRITAAELGERLGISADEVMALSLSAGLKVSAHDLAYTEHDVPLFATFRGGGSMFGEIATRRFVHTVGAALATVAEAAVSLFQINVEGPMRASGVSELELAQQNLRATQSLEQVQAIMRGLFRPHVEAAIRRFREAGPRSDIGMARMTIGFIDMVGFTPLAHRVSTAELREVVERFEETAHEVVTTRDGRLVKLIGDEVMFVTREPGAACDIALTLIERFAGDPSVKPRGGLATGDLLVRGGDYYGPIVNLAARVAQLAVPHELLVTQEVAAHAVPTGLRFEPAGRRAVKGLEEPVTLLTVDRA